MATKMVRACRQPLTTTQDEIDAFAFARMAIEFEREKRKHDAVRMQSQGSGARAVEVPQTRAELTEHECAQEKLYLMWRSGRVRETNVAEWAASLTRLQAEGNTDYFCWLMRTHAELS